jgi:hypothetical protein
MRKIPKSILYKCAQSGDVKRLIEMIHDSLFLIDLNSNEYYRNSGRSVVTQSANVNSKRNEDQIEYGEGQRLYRRPEYDREFPVETVRLQRHELIHDNKVENAMVHIGPSADEYARTFNALAVTIATDIYFRNGAYRPETEEGRKLLAHELTHVAQYREGNTDKNINKKELEQEAVAAEGYEAYEEDPIVEVEIGGNEFRLRQSELSEVIEDAAEEAGRWFKQQKTILSERKYLELLCAYAEWKKGRVY